jgi:hypothetical protein
VKVSRVLAKMRNIPTKYVEAVFPYWVQKRVSRGHLPLLKMFDPSVMMLTRPTIIHNPRIHNDGTSYEKMISLRFDLERVRNALEVIIRRERAKLEQVELWSKIVACGANTPLQRQLARALLALRAIDKEGFFAEPVSELEVPGYHDAIAQPMDFRTMQARIDANAYVDWRAFAADFELICANASAFNSKSSVYYRAARMLLMRGTIVVAMTFDRKYRPESLTAREAQQVVLPDEDEDGEGSELAQVPPSNDAKRVRKLCALLTPPIQWRPPRPSPTLSLSLGRSQTPLSLPLSPFASPSSSIVPQSSSSPLSQAGASPVPDKKRGGRRQSSASPNKAAPASPKQRPLATRPSTLHR